MLQSSETLASTKNRFAFLDVARCLSALSFRFVESPGIALGRQLERPRFTHV